MSLIDCLTIDTNLPASTQSLISQVDNYLPQTQCGLCGHPDGCLPYAKSIVLTQEAANKCVPGGQPVADDIAKILGRPSLPAIPSKWSIDPTTRRPQALIAVIEEADCIGCTKCIPACPVDAIIGSGKHMHTIFADLCTGCELCLSPCPVDCITLVPQAEPIADKHRSAIQDDLRHRYHQHMHRLAAEVNDDSNTKPTVSAIQAKLQDKAATTIDKQDAQQRIQAARLRTKIKRLEKQLASRPNSKKSGELATLNSELAQLLSST